MSKRKIVIGNWKMNPESEKEAMKLFLSITKGASKFKKTEVVTCPPYVYLSALKGKSKKISLGAQDVFWEESGAFTGEVSPTMLEKFAVKYAILGHSERRALGETNIDINRKIKASLVSGLAPILCVGENERNENHEYLNFIKTQIEECLSGVAKSSLAKIVIAYEPVWAIGKNATRSATAEEYLEMSIFIKKVLSDRFGAGNIADIRIIYGGSVHPENAQEFLQAGKADGFLAGRDSLDSKKFLQIIDICEASKN